MQLPAQPGFASSSPARSRTWGSPQVEPMYDEQVAEIVGRLLRQFPGDQFSSS
jgi:hypothetical protein